MKVRDLLEELAKFPPEADIAFEDDGKIDGYSIQFNGFREAGPRTTPFVAGVPVIECGLEIIPWEDEEDDDNPLCKCGNCGHICRFDYLNDIKDYHERVDEDDEYEPDGECPKCGALAYICDDDEEDE